VRKIDKTDVIDDGRPMDGPPKGALLTMRREEELGFNSTNFSAVIIALYQLMRINQRGLWGKTFET
jgi:hypothetical protein